VPVRYHPDNPQQAHVDTPWARMWAWMLPGALGLLGGLGLLAAGVIVYLQESPAGRSLTALAGEIISSLALRAVVYWIWMVRVEGNGTTEGEVCEVGLVRECW
jgi:ABC-type uncharacterized transport system permease subunit